MALQDPNIMPLSCSGCPMSLKTPNMGNPGYDATISFGLPFELGDCPYGKSRLSIYSVLFSEATNG